MDFKQIITCSTSFTSNVQERAEVSSSLERICDTYKEAEALLERLYTDALNKEENQRFGTHLCDPVWLSENKDDPWKHSKLQVTQKGPYGMVWVSIYEIHQDLEKNYLSKQPWL